MNIGLIDVDSHNFPNLALMKISAYEKQMGNHVEWWNGLKRYDRVYKSKIFDETYSHDEQHCIMADEIICGGTGYGLDDVLPEEIEHIYPDYKLYDITDTAYGFLTRGCPRGCPFCIVSKKEGRKSRQVADLSEFWHGEKTIKLLDPNLLAYADHIKILRQLADSEAYVDFTQGLDARLLTDENINLINQIKLKEIHFAWDNMKDEKQIVNGLRRYSGKATRKPHGSYGTVYVLTNYGTTHEEDLYRIYKLRDMGYDPYVMIYDKPTAPVITKRLQRWCNNRMIFKSQPDFSKYRE